MNKLDELHAQIKQELDLCDKESTPWVCKMKETDYDELSKLITSAVVNQGETISNAIMTVERSYNPNYIND